MRTSKSIVILAAFLGLCTLGMVASVLGAALLVLAVVSITRQIDVPMHIWLAIVGCSISGPAMLYVAKRVSRRVDMHPMRDLSAQHYRIVILILFGAAAAVALKGGLATVQGLIYGRFTLLGRHYNYAMHPVFFIKEMIICAVGGAIFGMSVIVVLLRVAKRVAEGRPVFDPRGDEWVRNLVEKLGKKTR